MCFAVALLIVCDWQGSWEDVRALAHQQFSAWGPVTSLKVMTQDSKKVSCAAAAPSYLMRRARTCL